MLAETPNGQPWGGRRRLGPAAAFGKESVSKTLRYLWFGRISRRGTYWHIERYMRKHLEGALRAMGDCEPAQVALASRVKLDTEGALASESGGCFVSLVEIASLLSIANYRRPPLESDLGRSDPTKVADVLKHSQHLFAAGLGRSALDINPSSPSWQLGAIGRGREVFLRATVYDSMLLETLSILFRDQHANLKTRRAIGFGGKDALQAIFALKELSTERLMNLAKRYEDLYERMTNFVAAYTSGKGPDLDESFVEQAERVTWEITEGLAEGCAISCVDVSEASGLPLEVAQRVLDAFTIAPDRSPREMFDRFISGDDPFRIQPLIGREDGTVVLVHESLAMSAIREGFERAIRQHNGLWQQYEKMRGQTAEEIAIDALTSCLGEVQCYRSLYYFVPDPEARTEQTHPDQYTKRVEVDGLILVDDIALIIEVKAVALTPEARSGPDRAVATKLKSIVSRAANQGYRLYDRIFQDRVLKIGDNRRLDVSSIQEAYVITVSLEDLSGTLASIDGMVEAGIVERDRLPWTVSLHDLKIVCMLIEYPSQLLIYLRRRTHRGVMRQILAMDEIDIFVLFLEGKLYRKGDPLHREMDATWPTRPWYRFRKLDQSTLYIVESRTEAVDRWMNGLAVRGAEQADPPRMTIDSSMRRTLTLLSQRRPFGWFATSAALLEGSASLRTYLASIELVLLRKLLADDQDHYHGFVLQGSADMRLILLWYASNEPFSDRKSKAVRRRLEGLLERHEARSCSCLYVSAATGQVEGLVYWPEVN